MEKGQKSYIGDAVYVQFDGYHLVLTTEDGIRTSNIIALEDAVFLALCKFAERAWHMKITVADEPDGQ